MTTLKGLSLINKIPYISAGPTIALEDQSSIFKIVHFMSRIEEADRGERWQHLMPSYGQFGQIESTLEATLLQVFLV